MAEDPLSDREVVVMELQVRYEYLTSLLGVNPTARNIFRILHMNNKGWSISGLARECNVARSTVRAVIDRNRHNGIIAFENGLIYITHKGSTGLIRIQRETFRIAFGQQVGFSVSVIKILRNLTDLKIDFRASTVCFDKSLPDFING